LDGHMDVVEIEDMSGSELLEHAERLATTQHRCEVEILQVGVQHAYLHNCATLDPDESARPGRERSPSSLPLSWGRGWGCRTSRPGG
jgi:hypothetical protein